MSRSTTAGSVTDDSSITTETKGRNLGALSSYKINVLKENNWHAWKLRMQKYLCLHKVFKYAEGTCPKPAEDIPNNSTKVAMWEEEDLIAQTLILTNIDDAQMWESLQMAHQTHGVQTVLLAKRDLLNAKCPEDENVPIHINKLKKMRNELSAMGKPVPDDEFKDILLLNMPESWSTFTTSYMAGRLARKEASSVTVEQLTAVLVDKYKHWGSTSPGQTLIAQLHDKWKEPGVTCSHCRRDNHSTDQCHHKGKPKCGYCHRIGHTKDRCWTKDGRGPPKRANTAQTNFASTLEVRDVQDDEQVLMVDGQGASSNNNNIYLNSFTVNWKDGIEESIAFYTWVTDTSSSVHLTNTRDVFKEITPVRKVIKGIGDHAVIASVLKSSLGLFKRLATGPDCNHCRLDCSCQLQKNLT